MVTLYLEPVEFIIVSHDFIPELRSVMFKWTKVNFTIIYYTILSSNCGSCPTTTTNTTVTCTNVSTDGASTDDTCNFTVIAVISRYGCGTASGTRIVKLPPLQVPKKNSGKHK